MRVGYCTVNYTEWPIEKVIDHVAGKGYEAIEIPAYTDNGQIDPDELLRGDNAKRLKKRAEDAGLLISAISNHADSPLVPVSYTHLTLPTIRLV